MIIRRERTEITNFWFKYNHPKYEFLKIRLNPFTTFSSLTVIVAFIVWCISDPISKYCWGEGTGESADTGVLGRAGVLSKAALVLFP